MENGEKIRSLIGNTGRVRSLSFSKNGNTLTSIDENNTVIIWNMPDGKTISNNSGNKLFIGPTRSPLSPDQQHIINGGIYTNQLFYDPLKIEGKRIGPFTVSSGTIGSQVFSPDGTILALGGYDRTIVLWNFNKVEPIVTLSGHKDSVDILAFSPDGKILASGSNDTTVRLWSNLEPDLWGREVCQLVGRNFTQSEWEEYFKNEPYRITCPEWPGFQVSTPTPTP